MANNIDDLELDEMRSQIAILKDKLEKETIVSDQMLRSVLGTKVKSLREKRNVEYVSSVLVILMGIPVFHAMMGFSWAFVIITDLLVIASMYVVNRIYGPVTENGLMTGNLLDVAQRMSKFKKHIRLWIMPVSVPVVLSWFAFFSWEIWHSTVYDDDVVGKYVMQISGTIGLVVGAYLGVKMDLSAADTADEIIRQIEQ